MARKKKTLNWEQVKANPAAFMKEIAQIDNGGEMSHETLVEINGGGKLPIDNLNQTLGIIYNPPTTDSPFLA